MPTCACNGVGWWAKHKTQRLPTNPSRQSQSGNEQPRGTEVASAPVLSVASSGHGSSHQNRDYRDCRMGSWCCWKRQHQSHNHRQGRNNKAPQTLLGRALRRPILPKRHRRDVAHGAGQPARLPTKLGGTRSPRQLQPGQSRSELFSLASPKSFCLIASAPVIRKCRNLFMHPLGDETGAGRLSN